MVYWEPSRTRESSACERLRFSLLLSAWRPAGPSRGAKDLGLQRSGAEGNEGGPIPWPGSRTASASAARGHSPGPGPPSGGRVQLSSLTSSVTVTAG